MLASISESGSAGLQSSHPWNPTFMAVSPLGLIKERVAWSASNVTVLGVEIKLWGFML